MASKVEIYTNGTLTHGKEFEIVALSAVVECLPKNVSFHYTASGDLRIVNFVTTDERLSHFSFDIGEFEDLRECHAEIYKRVYETLVKLIEKSGKMCGKENQLFRAKPVRGKK